MNVTSLQAMHEKGCPIMSANNNKPVRCQGDACMLWQYDEPMMEGPDSYISDPPPTGHCGLARNPE